MRVLDVFTGRRRRILGQRRGGGVKQGEVGGSHLEVIKVLSGVFLEMKHDASAAPIDGLRAVLSDGVRVPFSGLPPVLRWVGVIIARGGGRGRRNDSER